MTKATVGNPDRVILDRDEVLTLLDRNRRDDTVVPRIDPEYSMAAKTSARGPRRIVVRNRGGHEGLAVDGSGGFWWITGTCIRLIDSE
jgi:hypothetical protein